MSSTGGTSSCKTQIPSHRRSWQHPTEQPPYRRLLGQGLCGLLRSGQLKGLLLRAAGAASSALGRSRQSTRSRCAAILSHDEQAFRMARTLQALSTPGGERWPLSRAARRYGGARDRDHRTV